MQYRLCEHSFGWRLLHGLAVLWLFSLLGLQTSCGVAGFVVPVCAAPKSAPRSVGATSAATVSSGASAAATGSPQQIIGNPRLTDAPAPDSVSSRKGKSNTRRLRAKRVGQPMEVRVVQSDGREQVFKGFAERGSRRASAHAAARAGSAGDARERRVLRLHVPGG